MVEPWSNNKPWLYSVCTMQTDKKGCAVVRGGERGHMRGKRKRSRRWRVSEIRIGGREGWTVLWMDRVFNPPTHWIVCHRLLRLYVEWEELAESCWIPESLRHVVWLAEQNPHSGEEQTWLPTTPPQLEFSTSWRRGGSKFVLLCYGCKSVSKLLRDFSLFFWGLCLHSLHCSGHVNRISTFLILWSCLFGP